LAFSPLVRTLTCFSDPFLQEVKKPAEATKVNPRKRKAEGQ